MSNDEHSHDFVFAAVVLEGNFELTTDEGDEGLGPGDLWSLGPT